MSFDTIATSFLVAFAVLFFVARVFGKKKKRCGDCCGCSCKSGASVQCCGKENTQLRFSKQSR